jgi:hypothetical protein
MDPLLVVVRVQMIKGRTSAFLKLDSCPSGVNRRGGTLHEKDDLNLGVATQNLDDVTEVPRAALTCSGGEHGVGRVMAGLLEAVLERHRDKQLATVALMVWSEALRCFAGWGCKAQPSATADRRHPAGAAAEGRRASAGMRTTDGR